MCRCVLGYAEVKAFIFDGYVTVFQEMACFVAENARLVAENEALKKSVDGLTEMLQSKECITCALTKVADLLVTDDTQLSLVGGQVILATVFNHIQTVLCPFDLGFFGFVLYIVIRVRSLLLMSFCNKCFFQPRHEQCVKRVLVATFIMYCQNKNKLHLGDNIDSVIFTSEIQTKIINDPL